jgi:hypothetical protein
VGLVYYRLHRIVMKFEKDDLIILSHFPENNPEKIWYKRLFRVLEGNANSFKWIFIQDLFVADEHWEYKNTFFDDKEVEKVQEITYDIIKEHYTEHFKFEKIGIVEDFPEYFI